MHVYPAGETSTIVQQLLDWVAPDDAHPNAEAHGLIAEYTLPFLLEDPGS